ncbi:MAG: Translation elongation factor P [Brockia lithotrophica]|uniref:Elongation factor P n=1 Tax=Brockia lithotrophica TaxID=933949 RepID=A0A2T5G677_9BACL|nr:elongation factor P [Brockia lithotrophica]MBT9252395.1 elongation factor P [Brockia lithotrophica]PTQ51696.1 MAG: Translation elongation factor P [Brockia lithotrophica]
MISTNDFYTGAVVIWENDPWQVLEFMHVKPGKGSPFVRAKLKNLRTGNIRETTFRAGEKLPRADVRTREMQFLYASGDEYVFMDTETFEQVSIPRARLEHEVNFLKENLTVHVMFYGDEVLGVDLPQTVTLQVVETEPGIRGDTVSGATKPAKLETGYIVQVPLFVNQGDWIVVDTRSGEYVSRA